MRTITSRLFGSAVALALAVPGVALAHPGHGHGTGFEVTHYLAEPEHAVPALAVVAMAVMLAGGVAVVRRRRRG